MKTFQKKVYLPQQLAVAVVEDIAEEGILDQAELGDTPEESEI